MGAWVTLAATVVGAAIALAGQNAVRHGEARMRFTDLLLEQCVQLNALDEDFRNRIWEEKELGLSGRVELWDLRGHRIATARLRVLCRDEHLLHALDEVVRTGKQLGRYWRRGQEDSAETEELFELYTVACAEFLAAAAVMIEKHLPSRSLVP